MGACVVCGEPVSKRSESGLYCSHRCYNAAPKPEKRNGKEVVCALCGKAFYLPAARLARATRFFCSPDHANEFQRRTKVECECRTCGKKYLASPSRPARQRNCYCSQECYQSHPDRKPQLVSMNAGLQLRKETRLERDAYAALDALGVDYERQRTIDGKFTVDALVEGVVVVQFDGDYWHGNPARYSSPDARQRKRMTLDRSQDAYLRAHGYRIARVWESEFRDDATVLARRLAKAH